MADHRYEELSLHALLLNLENPRYDPLGSQREALQKILGEQDDKLVNLARDILMRGTNPSDFVMVSPSDGEEEEYVVLEGNRRLAALKLLFEPSLAQTERLKKRFEALVAEYEPDQLPHTIRCVIFDEPEDARYWIELKHTGENKGVGTVGWDGVAVARFQNTGKRGLAFGVLQFLTSALPDFSTEKFPISSLVLQLQIVG